MAHQAVSTPAGTKHPTREVPRSIVLVNLPKLLTEIETTTQLIHDCVANNGNIYRLDDNIDEAYVCLDLQAVPILEDLHRTLQSQLQRMTTYATAVPMDSKNYNNIHANAVSAITTAEIYLQSADMMPSYLLSSDPDVPMDVDNVGEQTPSEAATDNNPDTHEQTPSNEANENTLDMQAADDIILELKVRKDEMDQLYTVENPSELSTTRRTTQG